MGVNDSRVLRLHRRAKALRRHVVMPEGTDPRVLAGAARATRLDLARVTLLGDPDTVKKVARSHGTDLAGVDVRPVPEDGPEADAMARAYRERRSSRGLTLDEAREEVRAPVLFAMLQTSSRRYDAVVTSGGRDAFRAALAGIEVAEGVKRVSSFTLILAAPVDSGEGGVFLFSDCALNPDPSATQLAEIALLAEASARAVLDESPRLALLSFSTHGSADHARVKKVAEASRVLRARAPLAVVDGEIQVDAALVPGVAGKKAPTSPLGGRANVLVFPDLDSAAIGAAIVQTLAGARALGPIFQGQTRPVGFFPRDWAGVDDVVDLVALTAIGAPGRETTHEWSSGSGDSRSVTRR